MEHDLLTTAEAARIAGVGTTSVKRWADSNLLRCIRTAGGHRRFRREELDRFLSTQSSTDATSDHTHDWIETLLNGGPFEIQAELLRARDRLEAWYRVAEELGSALVELGLRWQRSEISVVDEHVASEKLLRAINRVVESIPGSVMDPECMLASAEEEDHTLALALAELCLREVGWRCTWSGRRTPADTLAETVARGEIKLLALSASIASSDADKLAAEAKRVGEACRQANVLLALGGRGAWPEHPLYGVRVHGFAAFHRLAADWRRELLRPNPT